MTYLCFIQPCFSNFLTCVYMSFGSKLQMAIVGSTQGKVATAGYVVLLFTIILSIMYQNNRENNKSNKLKPLEIVVVFCLLFIAYILAIYSINCMVIGASAGVGCGLWAWANAIIVVIFVVAMLLSMFLGDDDDSNQAPK